MPIYPDADEQQQITKKIIRGVASYKQILGGKVIVDYLNYVAPVIPLKITSITNPSPGRSSITGNTTATLTRSSSLSQGTFTVNFENYNVSKGAGIRLTGSIEFEAVYNSSQDAYVNIAGKQIYSQSGTGAQTKSFDNTITPSSTNGAFNIVVYNGYNPYDYQMIRVYLTIEAL